MKAKVEWWKLSKRCALIALSICCVAAMMGCDDDDSSSGKTPGQLAGTVWLDDAFGTLTLNCNANGSSFQMIDIGAGMNLPGTYTETGNAVTFSASGNHPMMGGSFDVEGNGTFTSTTLTATLDLYTNKVFFLSDMMTFTKQ